MSGGRRRLLAPLLEGKPFDFYLITNPVNILYFIGRPTLFDTHFNGAILFSKTAAILFTDFRYLELAEKAGIDAEVRLIKKDLVSDVAQEIGSVGLGIESDYLRVGSFLKLKELLKDAVVPDTGLIEEVRAVKDEAEIASIAGAARIGDKVFDRILERLAPGVVESDIAVDIETMFREEGASKASFEPIVASGPNSAIPHATVTDRKLLPGDFVKLDVGCVYQGYCSDMTRTVVLGKASNEQKRIYDLVKEGQRLALEGLVAGMSGREADALARDYFAGHGEAENFGHNLGHGVGLEVHERPVLGRRSDEPLKVNNVFTVEPGLYHSGFGGVRIEDMVVLRERGPELLTKSTKELLEL